MALNKTTISAAVSVTDAVITVASATGFAAGNFVRIDNEIMRISKAYVSGTQIPIDMRGASGTQTIAHVSGANAVCGLGSDFADAGPGAGGSVPLLSQPVRDVRSYSASGAIALPSGGRDMLAVLNGTSTLTMTVANPTTDLDGSILYVIANGKAAHTLTVGGSSGVGNGGSTMDVGTYNTTEATGCALMAMNGFWVLWANGIGSSGTQVAGVVFA